MSPKVFYGVSPLGLFGIDAITVWPMILVRDSRQDHVLMNHEMIHWAQIQELGPLRFYLIYFFEFFSAFFKCWSYNTAYSFVSFELEAYAHEADLSYTDTRKKFAWKDYTNKLNI